MTPKRPSVLLILLALTTIGGGVLAWHQHRELTALRGNSGDRTNDDKAALKKRLADAEHRAHDLQNELDALKGNPTGETSAGDEPSTVSTESRPGRSRGPEGGRETFRAMLDDPKIVQLMSNQNKQALDSRYAALFKNLVQGANLSPMQLDTLKNLLVEKQSTMRDVMLSARNQGVTDRGEINQLIKTTQAEIDAQIQNTLGPAGYQQYQQYEKTLPQRALVNQLAQSLSYTSAPLNDSQTQQLIQALADNATSSPDKLSLRKIVTGSSSPGATSRLGGGTTITDAALAQAQNILTPPQMQALAALKQAQQDQQELIKAMNISRPAHNTKPPSVAPAPPAAKP